MSRPLHLSAAPSSYHGWRCACPPGGDAPIRARRRWETPGTEEGRPARRVKRGKRRAITAPGNATPVEQTRHPAGARHGLGAALAAVAAVSLPAAHRHTRPFGSARRAGRFGRHLNGDGCDSAAQTRFMVPLQVSQTRFHGCWLSVSRVWPRCYGHTRIRIGPSGGWAVLPRRDRLAARKRALFAGMTDYTGVPMEDMLSHLRDWRDQTLGCVEALLGYVGDVEAHRNQFDSPNDIVMYLEFFIDLFGRYSGDFERLLVELPMGVTEAHVEIVRQIYDSAVLEDSRGSRFARDHVETGLKDESLRWLVDKIYQDSAGMLVDYHDLSNLQPRLRTFVGAKLVALDQKFGILRSPAQEKRDFDRWAAVPSGDGKPAIGVVFFDIDDFKRLNSQLTESVVDRDILPPLHRLVRDITPPRGAAYSHGGDEFLVMVPDHGVDKIMAFAEELRARIEAEVFADRQGVEARLTISAGVAVWPRHGETCQQSIEAANRAEHEAKATGRNRVCSAPA